MDITTAFSAVLQTLPLLGNALDTHDKLKLLETKSLFANQLLELQNALIAHYARHIEIQQELAVSNQKLVQLQERLDERLKYELVKVGIGFFVYALKGGDQDHVLAHYLCQPCFDSGAKSVLQPTSGMSGTSIDTLTCPICKFWVRVK